MFCFLLYSRIELVIYMVKLCFFVYFSMRFFVDFMRVVFRESFVNIFINFFINFYILKYICTVFRNVEFCFLLVLI